LTLSCKTFFLAESSLFCLSGDLLPITINISF
jgi:hypothetical protein